jgi:hypothetical protein
MSSAPNANPTPPQEPSTLAAVLSYLVPGLGQIYQGRYGKGVLFMVSLLGMFMLGQAMGDWKNVYVPDSRNQQGGGRNLISALMVRWHYGGQFWIGMAAWPALAQYYKVTFPGEETSPFLHNYQKAPDETAVNNLLRDSDKTPDLGWVYTVIAGMLNLLVIYDAYVGPLPITLPRLGSKESPAAKMDVKKEGLA